MHARVRDGLSIADAAKAGGMSANGFHKALQRPEVKEYQQEVQHKFVLESESSRAFYKARAFEVALDLMKNAQSETVRARMVEFLAGDGKAPQVAVHVDARTVSGEYAFVRPGGKVVEIQDPSETAEDETPEHNTQ
ncbi:hypothetical protein GCM10011315_02700 [Roseovarius pacificus]|nr:hypothetical protein GCM10011315_02700 [Roseovarius pacificus]